MSVAPVLRIANASGFYGDRESAVHEMITGGDIDVLTGDYLAELTMSILAMDRLKNPDRGYARSFLRQMEGSLGPAVDAGIKVVVNAGGLNPAGLAAEVRALAERLGIGARVAHVEGDDLLGRLDELGLNEASLDRSGTSGSGVGGSGAGGSGLGAPLAANAYLGAFGIAAALKAGADVVVTGRVTDASLVVGPAAAHFGWTLDDRDALAGAVVAGHVIECGAQATGGNFAFFTEIADLGRIGFPVAEVRADGSCTITKHPGTGGAVTPETVTAQLLYEIGGARYAGPDVTTRFDSVSLNDEGPDRVGISGAVGEPPPPTLKVGLNSIGGYRNEVTFVLTGLDIEAKADLVRRQMEAALGDVTPRWTLARTDHPDAASEAEASALLHCVVRADDGDSIGRIFSGAAIELALASYPGFHVTAPPTAASPYGVFTAAHIPAGDVPHVVVDGDGGRTEVAAPSGTAELLPVPEPVCPPWTGQGPTRRVPLGTVVGARSGDKGGSANIGAWARDDRAFDWLAATLTVEELRRLLPEVAPLELTRHVFANLRALNFVIEGILGQGVSSQHRFDPQAKALGEWLRSRHVDVPEELL